MECATWKLAWLWQFVREAIDRGDERWLFQAMIQVTDPEIGCANLPSAERFAMGEALSEHILALDFAQCNQPASLVFPEVARYYHEIGNKDRAVELIELALKSLDGPDPDMHGLKKTLNHICCRRWPTTRARRFVPVMFVWSRGRIFRPCHAKGGDEEPR